PLALRAGRGPSRGPGKAGVEATDEEDEEEAAEDEGHRDSPGSERHRVVRRSMSCNLRHAQAYKNCARSNATIRMRMTPERPGDSLKYGDQRQSRSAQPKPVS